MIVRNPFASQRSQSTQMLTSLKEALDRQTAVATSGVAVQDIDDAAGLWRQIDNLEQSRVNLDVYLDNGERAESMLRVADIALEEAADVVAQARSLAVYLGNANFTAEDRVTQANEIDQMLEGLVQLGNAQFGERYVFAGTAYDAPAFDPDGTYRGNADQPTIQIAESHFTTVGWDGSASFGVAFTALEGLAAALRSGDQTAVTDQIATIDDAFDGLVEARQLVGHEQSDADRINGLTRSLQITVVEALDQLVAEDPIDALTQLTGMQTAYQIALQVTASRGSTTLFDYLR